MKRPSGIALLMVGVLIAPTGAALALESSPVEAVPLLIARRGGGGRSGGGSRGRTGFQGSGGAGGLNRGSSRPTGGWSRGGTGQVGSPSLNPPARRPGAAGSIGSGRAGGDAASRVTRPGGSGSINRNAGSINRNVNRNINVNRSWTRSANVNAFAVRPGWARPGWGVARPWNHGWYGGWVTPSWGWWGARAAAWGVGTLATAAIINSAVDAAVASNQTTIVVPNSDYQLLYGTVQPTGTYGVSFDVSADGSVYQLSADCQAGLLNGQEPQTAQEAELLNAACQVAFGTAS